MCRKMVFTVDVLLSISFPGFQTPGEMQRSARVCSSVSFPSSCRAIQGESPPSSPRVFVTAARLFMNSFIYQYLKDDLLGELLPLMQQRLAGETKGTPFSRFALGFF